MNDTIKIKNLEIFASHGVLSEENKLGQKFLVSAEMYTDFSEAVQSDNLSLSVDYGDVCKEIKRYMTDNTFKLIETAARGLAENLLDKFSAVKGVVIEVQKPWAPINMSLETVSVMTERKWHTVYVSIGSNMGDRKKYINDAIQQLSETKGCIVEKVSDLILTEPYGGVGQNSFYNCALKLKTYFDPHELLECFHRIEEVAQRKREIRWGPRTLDLDIIFYDNEIIDDEVLNIPHIDMQNRAFVLEPLSQIAPFVRHPVLNKTVGQLFYDLKGTSV